MRVDSLEELVAAFGEWRRRKRHLREPTPEDLVKRARRAAGVHGLGRVARAAKLNRRLLEAQEVAGRAVEGALGKRRVRGEVKARICNERGEWLYQPPEGPPSSSPPPPPETTEQSRRDSFTARGAV